MKVSNLENNQLDFKSQSMIKKILLLSFLTLMVACLNAQIATNFNALQQIANENSIKESDEYARAIGLAKNKGWVIAERSKDGRTISLVGADILGKPIYLTTYNNIIAAATTRANQLWPGGSSGLNLSGSSASIKGKLATWDGGLILNTHVEINRRVLQKDSATVKHDDDDHATHTTGTMIASGVNPIAKGMAYGAQQLIAYDYYNDVSEMSTEAPNLLLSNHSYGRAAGWQYDGIKWTWYGDLNVSTTEDYGFGYYSSEAQAYDSIAYNAPKYLIDFAAGNSRDYNGPAVGSTYSYYDSAYSLKTRPRPAGISNNSSYGTIAYGANSKNTLIVGAVNPLLSGYSKPSDVVMTTFSSWGPTDDGRIKPDVVADGANVTSCIATSNTAYASYSGTSMATPNTTGSLYLLQEYYNKLHPGNFMRSATLKGLAIHTADEAGTTTGPDYQFGWGLLNVQKAASVITSSFGNAGDTIIENTLNNGGTYTYNVVASGKGQLVATLVWTDPPGTVNTTNKLNNPAPKLIHDLDLRITNGSSVYKPWILDPVNPGNAATKGDNILDNVERVNVDSVVPGQTYTITVTHKGTLARGSQAFSLLISGVGGTAYCTSAATSSAGTRIDSVIFGGIANKNIAGCTTYNSYTNLTGQIQAHQTLPLTVKVSSCDASTASKVVKVYIDYNNNGSFSDAGELVATSSVLGGGSAAFTTNITTPTGLKVGNYVVMRVITQETTDTSIVKPCGTYSNGETEDYRLQVVIPSNDISLSQVLSPITGGNFNASQLLTVSVKNNGSVDVTNVSLSATISDGTNTTNLLGNFPATVTAGNSITYTFQTPFNLAASTAYTITATATEPGDQDLTNNTLTQIVTTAAKATVSGTAELCNASPAFVQVNNPVSSSNYFWYDTQTNISPLLTGTSGNIPGNSIPTSNIIYLSSGARLTMGPADKTIYGAGSYNNIFSGGYTYDSAAVPIVIETAKIFANAAGQVKIAAHPAVKTGAGVSYYPSLGDSVIVDVYPNLDANGNDLGNDYYLNLHLDNSIANAYIFDFYCLNGASIFRNNALTISPYPIGPSNIYQILTTFASPNPNLFYYFLYNMKVVTLDNLSDRTAVDVISAPTPVATLSSGNLLTSSINKGTIQWNLNGNSIAGAVSATYTATQSGNYTVTVTDAFGCTKTSNVVAVTITAIQNVNDSEIGLVVSPNPNNGVFHVGFILNTKADVDIELVNAAGQVCLSKAYPGFSGQFNQQFNSSNLSNGTYILKVQQNGKVYRKRLLIIK